MNFLTEFIFFLKRPKVVLITGDYSREAAGDISMVLKSRFNLKKFEKEKKPSFWDILKFNVLVFGENEISPDEIGSLFDKSEKPILIMTNSVQSSILSENYVKRAVKSLPFSGLLILNFDNETNREIKNETAAWILTFGFRDGADLRITDIHSTENETNFKVSHKGNIIPFWLEKSSGKKKGKKTNR